jgi:hypothetical protein
VCTSAQANVEALWCSLFANMDKAQSICYRAPLRTARRPLTSWRQLDLSLSTRAELGLGLSSCGSIRKGEMNFCGVTESKVLRNSLVSLTARSLLNREHQLYQPLDNGRPRRIIVVISKNSNDHVQDFLWL